MSLCVFKQFIWVRSQIKSTYCDQLFCFFFLHLSYFVDSLSILFLLVIYLLKKPVCPVKCPKDWILLIISLWLNPFPCAPLCISCELVVGSRGLDRLKKKNFGEAGQDFYTGDSVLILFLFSSSIITYIF